MNSEDNRSCTCTYLGRSLSDQVTPGGKLAPLPLLSTWPNPELRYWGSLCSVCLARLYNQPIGRLPCQNICWSASYIQNRDRDITTKTRVNSPTKMPLKKKSKKDMKGEDTDPEEYGLSVAAAAKLEAKVTRPFCDKLGTEIKRAVGRSLEDYPRGENKVFRALVPRRDEDDMTWAADDEARIQALVEQPGSLPNELCKCPPVVDGAWRTCFRFLGCLASDIVGRKNNLVYGTNSHRGKNAYWSESFCQGLQYLIFHPHFNKSTAKMGLALQWASICRTQDSRKHSLNGYHGDVFLMMLQDVIQSAPGEPPAVQLEVARLLYKEESPGEDEPVWYNLLVGIDDASKRVQNKFDKLPGDMSKLYMVTSEDMAAVLSALDDIRHFSLPRYFPHQTYYDILAFTRCSDDRPSKKDVQEAIKQVVLSDLRHEGMQEFLVSPIPDSPQWPL